MEQKRLWSRMKEWIRPGARGLGGDGSLLGSASVRSAVAGEEESGGANAGRRAVGGVLSRRRRNDTVLEKLQEGYLQVIDLVDSMQKHQQRQDTRAMEISSSLSRVAETLGTIESSGRDQARTLARIADELGAGNERSARWEEALSEFPQMAEAQRRALSDVAHQMEAAGQRDNQMVQSLESFREAVTSLGDATTASSVAVKSLQMSALESHERTAALMKEQNKRFTMLFVVTLVLVATAIVAGLIALWGK